MVTRRRPTTAVEIPLDLDAARAQARDCTACVLYKNATQTVFGEGPRDARVVIVGEQPGDQEDIQGQPFVGPAGRCSTARSPSRHRPPRVYVTNAVKHFKYEPRGKRRIHKKPSDAEIDACHPWLEHELAAIDPPLVIALGATAIRALAGHALPILANRGRLLELTPTTRMLVTVHPSYLLRVPPEAQDTEYAKFVADLKVAVQYARKHGWIFEAGDAGLLRRAALPQQLLVPARRIASGGAGRARARARLHRAGDHRRMLVRRLGARAPGIERGARERRAARAFRLSTAPKCG